MDHLLLIPNYPPPRFFQNFAVNPTSYNLADVYKERLNCYLDSRKAQTAQTYLKNSPSTKLILREVSTDMSYSFSLIRLMNQKMEVLLREMSSMTKQKWDDKISEIRSNTGDLYKVCSKYEDNSVRNMAKYLVHKRQKKRHRISKRKVVTKLLKSYEAKQRTKKHFQIDLWLLENAKQISTNRCKIEIKQRVEQISQDVKIRKGEADKYVLILESLKELYQVRMRKLSTNIQIDDEFNREIDELKEMWSMASKRYEAEEENLGKILNCSKNLEEWQNMLFEKSTENKLNSFQKEDKCIDRIITIRLLWDKCIVGENNPVGTNLPISWVFSNLNPIEKWKIYLKTI